tara:strand:- start:149 stop:322 length:174 start_codon:yes stop_codon:yes gene_type:complete
MWVLLFVYMYDTYPYVETHSQHATMMKCFQAREALGAELSGKPGYFLDGQQAICIKT